MHAGDLVAGRFRILAELEPSEAGRRFEALIDRTGQPVVIAIASALDSARERARWAVDAALAERLDGRHVVRVFESGTLDDGTPWMAHEPTLGTLAAQIRTRGPLAVPEAVDWTLQACEAVAEAHAIGIPHGDIRPENVVLAHDPRGRVVAKVAWTGAAPVDHLDRAAVQRDIAGLAQVFRALVTGGVPDDAAPTLPSDLAHTVARATADDPGEPFANVAELARAFARHAPMAAHAARRAGLPLSRAGVVGTAIPLPRERVSEPWFARPPTSSLAPPPRSGRATAFLVVALTLLGATLGGTFAMARSGAARRWTGTAPVLLATTTLTSADTGTLREAEEVTAHAVEEWSLAKEPPRWVEPPPPPHRNDFPPTQVDEDDDDSGDEE